MRRIAVLGATGKLGEVLVNRALASGFEVHGFARDPQKLQQRYNESLALYKGDAEIGEGLEAAVEGCRFVISAFDPQTPATAMNVLKLLKTPPLGKLVFMSRLGVGDSLEQAKNASGLLTGLKPRLQKSVYQGFAEAEAVVRASALPWVILRAVALNDDHPGQEVVVADAKQAPPSRVARSDLSKFIMKMLDEPGWERREVTVGAKRV
jgi:putative NADH-flavin reductase